MSVNFVVPRVTAKTSKDYWNKRYKKGGNSGSGSYGKLADFKADFVNTFVKEHNIQSVGDFGCGDGNQLTLAKYPKYKGFDVSEVAVEICKELFKNDPTKSFNLMENYTGEKFDLSISMDVIFHLFEDEVFLNYMNTLFSSANKYVIIYSSNHEGKQQSHIRHRKFTDYIPDGWEFIKHTHVDLGSFSDFYEYKKNT